MHCDISGTVLQTLTIALGSDDRLWSQTHAMAWMSDGVMMDTHTGGGMMAGLGRALGGGSFFITEYASGAAGGEIAFAPHFPGQIIAMKLAEGESIVCRRETFLCSEASVRLDVILQRTIPAGLFAGQGFVVQKVSGPGTVWLDLSGESGCAFRRGILGCRSRASRSTSCWSTGLATCCSAAPDCSWRR